MDSFLLERNPAESASLPQRKTASRNERTISVLSSLIWMMSRCQPQAADVGIVEEAFTDGHRHDHREERGRSSRKGNPSDQPNVAWERLPWKK